MESKEEFMKSIKVTSNLSPKQKISIGYLYDEPYQLIEETHTVDLDNGWEITFTYSCEVYVSENVGSTWYDENQTNVLIDNSEVNIHEVWDGEQEIKLDEIAEKRLKLEILNSVE